MSVQRIIYGVGLAIFMAGATVGAHHAFSAEFDENKPVNLEGTLTKADWVNPHAWLYLDVKGADGNVSNWAIEMGPPNALLRRGWKKSSMQIGALIKVGASRRRTARTSPTPPTSRCRTERRSSPAPKSRRNSGRSLPADVDSQLGAKEHRAVVVAGGPLQQRADVLPHGAVEDRPSVHHDGHRAARNRTGPATAAA